MQNLTLIVHPDSSEHDARNIGPQVDKGEYPPGQHHHSFGKANRPQIRKASSAGREAPNEPKPILVMHREFVGKVIEEQFVEPRQQSFDPPDAICKLFYCRM